MPQKAKKALLIGVGSILFTDDGVGVRAVEYAAVSFKAPGLKMVDGGTGGLALLSIIKDYEKVIIMDAVSMGREPGSIKRFLWRRGKGVKRVKKAASSLHDLGVEEMLEVMALCGKDPKVVIVGMEPFFIGPGTALSPDAEARIPKLAEAAMKEAARFGIVVSVKRKKGGR